jgi:hypothetical protein
MKLSDRIRRWWKPGKWRDEHQEASEGEGFALSGEDLHRQPVEEPGPPVKGHSEYGGRLPGERE